MRLIPTRALLPVVPILLGACLPRQDAVLPELVRGHTEWIGDEFCVVVVLRNVSDRAVALADFPLELTVLDPDGEVLAITGPASENPGQLPPWDQDRIAFRLEGVDSRAARALVRLRNREGEIISELPLEEPER